MRSQTWRVVFALDASQAIVVDVFAAASGVARTYQTSCVVPRVAPIRPGVRLRVERNPTERVEAKLPLVRPEPVGPPPQELRLARRPIVDLCRGLALCSGLEELLHPWPTVAVKE